MVEETFYKKMLENLYDGVYFVDTDRKISFWNKGAERISGFSSEEVVGSHCYNNILNHIDNEGKALCRDGCPLHATIADGQSRETEVYLHHKEGHRVPVFVRTVPFYEGGKIIGAVEIFVDNTNRLETLSHLQKLKSLAMTDDLSGLPNRRYASEYLQSKMNEFRSLGVPFGLAFLDIDNFKKVNDVYGHSVGDEVIQLVARTSMNSLRKSDLMARWGGEEFIAIFIGIDEDELAIVSEKLRYLIENSMLRSSENVIKATVSIGATMARELDSVDDIINRADALMYQSKVSGKNRVTLSE